MGSTKLFAAALLALGISAGAALAQDAPPADRLYGRVVTAGGSEYEGYLRWDRNEGSWGDVLNGSKEIPWENARDAERLAYDRQRPRERSIEILGLRISWDEDEDDFPRSAQSGIRFGHLRALEVTGRDRARLVLKSGEEIVMEGGSTDLGDELRDLVVEDPERGLVELRWRDLDYVEFIPAPPSARAPRAERLHGTLRTRDGEEYTGFVSWDVDEILSSDILDGDERGRDREIPFHRIAAIERAGSWGARIVLRNGEEITLEDSNDVDDDNRGIGISDPALGFVTVDWDEFEGIRFHPPARGSGAYDAFDGGYPLWGTVETESGDRLTGYIRWDNDEESSWEILDGEQRNVEFDIEFGQIRSIAPVGSWGAEVTLRDGRVFELEDSNDVDEDNKGIYVTLDDGEVVLVEWWDLERVTFEGR